MGDENMVWTDSQDYGADEILLTSQITLFHKTTQFTSEITTLFRVPPQLFLRIDFRDIDKLVKTEYV